MKQQLTTHKTNKKSWLEVRCQKIKKLAKAKLATSHFAQRIKKAIFALRKKFHEIDTAFIFATKSSKRKKRH